jgi:hypothetical protein
VDFAEGAMKRSTIRNAQEKDLFGYHPCQINARAKQYIAALAAC